MEPHSVSHLPLCSVPLAHDPWQLGPLAGCQLDSLVFMTLDALRAHLCRSKWPKPLSLHWRSLPMCSGLPREPSPDWPSLLGDSQGLHLALMTLGLGQALVCHSGP